MHSIELFSQQLLPYLLVGGRIGGAISTLPGFSEVFISSRVRVALVLCISLGITPLVIPEGLVITGFPAFLFLKEVLIGLMFGALVKMIMVGIEVGGSLISYQMGVSNAFVQTPIASGSMPATFLVIVTTLLLFIADIHHIMLESILSTYKPFPLIPTEGNLSQLFPTVLEQAIEIISLGLRISLQIAAPILVISFILNSGFAVFNRLIPTIQVFFIMIPLQILVGFIVFTMSMHLTLPLLMEHFARTLQQLFH